MAAHLRHFERLFAENADPWCARDAWSEQHKRRTVFRALGAARLGYGLELGCGNGVTAREFAGRFIALLTIDGSPTAVRLARREVQSLGNVEVLQATLPCRLPRQRFDAVIASEILYYLPSPELAATLLGIHQALRPGGRLLSTNHWRRFQDAECSHQRLTEITRTVFGTETRRIAGAGWVCHVFRRRPRT